MRWSRWRLGMRRVLHKVCPPGHRCVATCYAGVGLSSCLTSSELFPAYLSFLKNRADRRQGTSRYMRRWHLVGICRTYYPSKWPCSVSEDIMDNPSDDLNCIMLSTLKSIWTRPTVNAFFFPFSFLKPIQTNNAKDRTSSTFH